jgi:hypothetical protein
MLTQDDIRQLSPHLFWDVTSVNWEEHSAFIVQRILEYGTLEDYRFLLSRLGWKEIADIAVDLKSIDRKTLNFVATLSGVPLERFRCYTTKQYLRSSAIFS